MGRFKKIADRMIKKLNDQLSGFYAFLVLAQVMVGINISVQFEDTGFVSSN
jgi:hypothetical protein